jgi:hypothetical protein
MGLSSLIFGKMACRVIVGLDPVIVSVLAFQCSSDWGHILSAATGPLVFK